ncbi:hypothetical protein SAMN05216388_104217 [Halorientalis persicus]|uniref:Uncharacterized protein n=2 Tax=Halorientalis persicus TaxID=1367881 RepID=A0A1H8VW37_9EURY|nr:hypothetical protein SAMN05216388_104217 [Halorientalis persicus]
MQTNIQTTESSCTMPETPPAVPPLGGITDACGICGLPVESPAGVGAVGLNGICCRHCAEELPERRAKVAAIVREDQPEIRLFKYPGEDESPYSDSIGLVLVETPEMDDATTNTVTGLYELLEPEIQELVWQVAGNALPKTYTRFSDPALANGILTDTHLRDADTPDDHPYYEIADRLPTPYVATAAELFVDLHGSPVTAERVAQTILEINKR